MLAQNGKERKQLPVSRVGFLKGGALSSPLADGDLGLLGPTLGPLAMLLSCHCLRSRTRELVSPVFIFSRLLITWMRGF